MSSTDISNQQIKQKKIKRKQRTGEEIANAISHGVMAIFGVVVLVILLNLQTKLPIAIRPRAFWSAIIYGASIITLYLMSSLYHSLSKTKASGIFKRFDHISIFLLIGGTFAPALLLIPGLNGPFLGISWMPEKGLMLFFIQWFVILLGVIFKSIWVYKFQAFHYFIYLIIGWSAILFIRELYAFNITSFWLILAGGLAYTFGTVFYALSRIKYFHFIWHLWVNLGTILHFFAVYLIYVNLI